MPTAKIFMSGRSQAVRIPKEFRFEGDEVTIRRSGASLVLTPAPKRTWDDFFRNHTCPDFELDRSAAQDTPSREIFP